MLGNEVEWAQCDCGRWIYADCIIETAMDENRKPRIRSHCVMQLIILMHVSDHYLLLFLKCEEHYIRVMLGINYVGA